MDTETIVIPIICILIIISFPENNKSEELRNFTKILWIFAGFLLFRYSPESGVFIFPLIYILSQRYIVH